MGLLPGYYTFLCSTRHCRHANLSHTLSLKTITGTAQGSHPKKPSCLYPETIRKRSHHLPPPSAHQSGSYPRTLMGHSAGASPLVTVTARGFSPAGSGFLEPQVLSELRTGPNRKPVLFWPREHVSFFGLLLGGKPGKISKRF